MIKHIIGVLILLATVHLTHAQTEEGKLVREGNKAYEKKNYSASEKKYSDALGKDPQSIRGAFNLGNAYYKQKKYKEASEQFEMLSNRKAGDDTLSKVFHNLGNSYLQQKEYEKSIKAYKNALKKNYKDEDSRYNLAYAQKMLKQQQQQQQQNKDDQKKKDDDKKNQEQQQNQQDDQKKDQQKKDQEKQQKQQQNISKEDAERLLEAMNNDEKKLRDKMNEKKVKASKIQIEKDW